MSFLLKFAKALPTFVTFCDFGSAYKCNKLRVFNVGRLPAAPPKIKCKSEFFRKL